MTKPIGRPKGHRPGWNGTIEERLKRRTCVTGPNDCWTWTGHRSRDGYGKLDARCLGLGITNAHRVAYVIAHGPIDDAEQVLHRCDNPPCVNPAHLFLGTPRVNSDDKIAKGRAVNLCGEQHGRAKLTSDDVARIRQRFSDNPLPRRGCQNSETPNYCSTAREFGVSRVTIRRIVSGRIWRELT